VASPAITLLPWWSADSTHPIDGGGVTEVPEDSAQDCCTLLWGLPIAIVFFTIVVVVIVTVGVGKGGHSLGMMECAPSFWLPWMALAEMGRVWDDGCWLWCMMRSPAAHAYAGMMRSNQLEELVR
jgi:hypothetical protein